MLILGITNSLDSTVSLVNHKGIVRAAAEERFSRVKLDDRFPIHAIEYVKGAYDWNDIKVVAYGWASKDLSHRLDRLVSRVTQIVAKRPKAASIINERVQVAVERAQPRIEELDQFAAKNRLQNKVELFDHHLSHAAGAYYFSPFERALVVTADARGNFQSVGAYLGQGLQLTEVDWISMFDSPGFFYGAITDLLGFKPHRHEGKITGLAAYGNPKKALPIISQMLTYQKGTIRADVGGYYKPFYTEHLPALITALKPFSREDIAAALQYQLEKVMTRYIADLAKNNKVNNVCLAGGVFANVKLNQRIREIKGVKNVFIYPNMGDGGIATGAALLALAKRGKRPEQPISLPYFGPGFSSREIEQTLQRYGKKVRYKKLTDTVTTTVDLLLKEKVVGWFRGKMEYGPRALGNRSVLYHARDKSVNDWLNKRLKRTEFMPFAPFTTPQLAAKCFRGWNKDHIATKFMTMCYDCTSLMKKRCPAVVHVDGTARPQVIWRQDNPAYHDVVKLYYKKTGEPCLVNTSFNQHEQPIVCTPQDAIESLLGDNVDVLMLGDYVVERT